MSFSPLRKLVRGRSRPSLPASRGVFELLEERRLFASPAIGSLADITLPLGKAMFVPLTASDADGDVLSYTITSNRNEIKASLHRGNPYLKMTVTRVAFTKTVNGQQVNVPAINGTMVFELFKDLAPKTVRRITGLVNSDFYDGLTFHRIADLVGGGFGNIVQGGDPLGTGSGGPVFEFDDEVHPDGIFTGHGLLAMANSGQDTNGSQFFVTDGAVTHLNLRHSVFGQLVRGRNVVKAMIETPPNNEGRPTPTITITDAEIVENKTDAVLTIRAANGAPSDAVITVTVKDPAGNSAVKTFQVARSNDANDGPVFEPSTPHKLYTAQNTPITFDVRAIDVENDGPLTYSVLARVGGVVVGSSTVAVDVDPIAGGDDKIRRITVRPSASFLGTVQISLTVRDAGQHVNATDRIDVVVTDAGRVTEATPVNLTASTGVAGSFEVATFKFTDAAADADDFSAVVKWGDNKQVNATISKNGAGLYEVMAGNTFAKAGIYDFDVIVTGPDGAGATVTGSALAGTLAFTGQAATIGGSSQEQITGRVGRFTLDPRRMVTDYTATINWGDGSSSAGIITPLDGTAFAIDGAHTYAAVGNKTITVTVKDVFGQQVVINSTGNIALPPIRPNLGNPATIKESDRFKRTVTFTDPIGADWTATVDYGDGTVVNVPVNQGAKSLPLDHIYTDSKVYTIKVTVKDGASSRTGVATLKVTSANRPPALTVGGDSTGVRGQNRTLILSAVDPSAADNKGQFTYQINWGDGSKVQSVTGPATFSVVHAFGVEGNYKVTAKAIDKDGGASKDAGKSYSIKIAQLMNDPYEAGKKALAVGGTTGKDAIKIDGSDSAVRVTYGNNLFGTFAPTGRVLVFGGNADDKLTVSSTITRPLHLEGGGGNDRLEASGGADVLLGNAGNDTLLGAGGRDLLIGGAGKDSLAGGNDDDLLVANTSIHEPKVSSLVAIMREWTRNDANASVRLGHLQGTTSGGRNGNVRLDESTLGIDGDADLLTGQSGTDVFFLNNDTGTKDGAKDRTKKERLIDVD